jgi:hypothetical protein
MGSQSKMSEEKRAELYSSPGGRFIRADTLPRILDTGARFGKFKRKSTSQNMRANFTEGMK